MGLLARGGAPDCVASGFSCGAVRVELEEVLQTPAPVTRRVAL
jgi:hypothetical protein